MIIVDTNVVSELMLKTPQASVVRWLDSSVGETLWTTTITILELRFGIESAPSEGRRAHLVHVFEDVRALLFSGRVIAFDEPAAHAAASLQAHCKRRGLNVDAKDQMIAGVVLSRGATLATRNVRHFADAGVKLVNPFEPG